MDLGKDQGNLVWSLVLGQCGLMEETNPMMMDLEESKHMACILLLSYKLNLRQNGWVFSLEIRMLNLQSSQTKLTAPQPSPTLLLVDSLKYISSQKVTQNKS